MAPYYASGQIWVSDEQTPGLLYFRAQWALYPQGKDDSLDSAFNGWHVASHLLPTQSASALIEQQRRMDGVVTPAQFIEHAYG